ncbi:transposase zinc-binding domain-containing protein, partial [Paraburkholderia sp. BR10954]|uniref:transposase zinc-binding domain-containing protein n=1 Tax=Paraburkholderia sp. BR10954 TaxID=3236995 RepID=UPI0034D37A08
MRPAIEVADIFRRCGPQYRQTHAERLSRAQRRVMSAIELCRTAALGAHLEQCNACSHQRITYNSCLMGSLSVCGVDTSIEREPGSPRPCYSPLKPRLEHGDDLV